MAKIDISSAWERVTWPLGVVGLLVGEVFLNTHAV
jgi:hypothetical protein